MVHFFLPLACILVSFCLTLAIPFNEITSFDLELTLSNNRYLVILFYDDSNAGIALNKHFDDAVNSIGINELAEFSDVVKLAATDPNIQEIIDAYGITLPTIKVFRRGIMSDYRGPVDTAKNIATYIKQDSKPSVIMIDSLDELKSSLQSSDNTVVLGYSLNY